jgi:hypothetical protein
LKEEGMGKLANLLKLKPAFAKSAAGREKGEKLPRKKCWLKGPAELDQFFGSQQSSEPKRLYVFRQGAVAHKRRNVVRFHFKLPSPIDVGLRFQSNKE